MMENDINFRQHLHDGVGSKKIPAVNVIPSYKLTPTQLTNYLAGNTTNGDIFTNFDGTNYKIYVRMNGLWKSATLA